MLGKQRDPLKMILTGIVILGLALVAIVVTVGQYRGYHNPQKIQLSEYSQISNKDAKFSIDQSKDVKHVYYYISGWAYEQKKASETFETHLVLYRDNDQSALTFKTSSMSRPDVTKKSDDGQVHNLSGFQVQIPPEYINKKYKIGFLINSDSTQKLIKTNKEVK